MASPTKDNLDIFSERRDPNALKVRDRHMIGISFISMNYEEYKCLT